MLSGTSLVLHIRKGFGSQTHIYVTDNVHTHRVSRLANLTVDHQNAQLTNI